MIRGEILMARAKPAAWVMAGAAVAAVAGLAVTVALAAGGPAVQHTATGRMSPGPGWAHIAAGDIQTCGIRIGGTLWCWGDNEWGQLGIGNKISQDRPRQVTTPATGGWASVTAGDDLTRRLHRATRTDAAPCGAGATTTGGDLGIGSNSLQDRPRQVTTPAAGWASVTVGDDYTCATRTGGTLWCWGSNDWGDLGVGNKISQDRPRQVTTPAAGGWASVTAGEFHTCATRTSGTLWCWGWNGHGELGIGSNIGQDRPRQVITPAPGGWASVTAGYLDTCSTRTSGTLWCWGYNVAGQLGIGNKISQDLPQQVTIPAPGGWAGVSAGDHTCASRADGTLWCWGYNGEGQLGIGNHAAQDLPRQVTGCGQPAAQPVRAERFIRVM